ncbi:MAG: DUF2065 domain-containing protein [Hyphomicrobium sp.]|nr:DUF2065 domain-containing protein [Hyphomicrobium sp.]
MSDLIVALGLMLVFEGLIWALVPGFAKRALEMVSDTPPATLQAFAWGAVAAGVGIVWLIRG